MDGTRQFFSLKRTTTVPDFWISLLFFMIFLCTLLLAEFKLVLQQQQKTRTKCLIFCMIFEEIGVKIDKIFQCAAVNQVCYYNIRKQSYQLAKLHFYNRNPFGVLMKNELNLLTYRTSQKVSRAIFYNLSLLGANAFKGLKDIYLTVIGRISIQEIWY